MTEEKRVETIKPWPLSQNKSFEAQRPGSASWTPCGRHDVVRAMGWWAIREILSGSTVVSENGVRFRKRS